MYFLNMTFSITLMLLKFKGDVNDIFPRRDLNLGQDINLSGEWDP